MSEKKTFLKIVAIFFISPGFVGAPLISVGVYFSNREVVGFFVDFLCALPGVLIAGFLGGVIFYGIPAFFLGLIYASMRLKRGWRSYIFVVLFSPFFVFLMNLLAKYYFSGMRNIFFYTADDDISSFLKMIVPLTSLASLIAAWLAFPKNEKSTDDEISSQNK